MYVGEYSVWETTWSDFGTRTYTNGNIVFSWGMEEWEMGWSRNMDLKVTESHVTVGEFKDGRVKWSQEHELVQLTWRQVCRKSSTNLEKSKWKLEQRNSPDGTKLCWGMERW